MPTPPPWRFRCYVSDDGVDQIRAWYYAQSTQCQAKFLARLRALERLPANEWKPELFRWLRGEAQGLGEIRFFADRIQQRPLGFRGPEPDVFTIIFPAKEKGDRFVPRKAIEVSLRRKREIEADRKRSNVCWLFNDDSS
jgi:hypothetical protein